MGLRSSWRFNTQTIAHDDECSALLQFKGSFTIRKSASDELFAYPKTGSWMREGDQNRSNCCLWDGVECHEESRHVIGLDLRSSFLYGSINSNSSLFQLVHLQRLDLADNDFNFSPIPSRLGHHLTCLTYLNLSYSVFSGQIPIEISKLSKLSTLDLSSNNDLELKRTNLRSLIQNFTSIKELDLSDVGIHSTVPDILRNATSLTVLSLRTCQLYGEFPIGIFQPPNLEVLDLYENFNLAGYIPTFNKTNSFKVLDVAETSFYGQLPNSIGNLHSLNTLSISFCNFYPRVPSSLRNLTQLTYLDISSFYDIDHTYSNKTSQLVPDSWSWIGKLMKLHVLGLAYSNLWGNFPYFVANLTQLAYLDLSFNDISEFPEFLKNQHELFDLHLSANKIHGQIPKWFWNATRENLVNLDLSYNFLTGFDQNSLNILPWKNMKYFNIEYNRLEGSLPVLPQSIVSFDAGNNIYTGEISPLFCNLNYLRLLGLSNNNLKGILPQCLGNSSAMEILHLPNNSFHGNIPQICANRNSLRKVDLSYNKLQGKLPRSMANCIQLEFLNLGNNHINDIFPSWLGSLPVLRALLLRSNRFHGEIGKPPTNHEFPNLCIIDLSNNGFSGMLPSIYLQNWNFMKLVNETNQTYFEVSSTRGSSDIYYILPYSMTINAKGVELKYLETPYLLRLIDLSSNRFEGEIPGVIGNLTGLHLLNLSNNILTGLIPSSLGNLTSLNHWISLKTSSQEGSPAIWYDSIFLHISTYPTTGYGGLYHSANNLVHS
nr:receptor-like protein Cf-9 [Malus domestica]